MYIMQTDTTPDIFTSGAHAVKRLALYPGGIHKKRQNVVITANSSLTAVELGVQLLRSRDNQSSINQSL